MPPKAALALAGLLLAGPVAAGAAPRLPDIPPAAQDAEQKKAADDYLAARGAPLGGPFASMLYSPQLMTAARQMGDYLRFHAAIGPALSELVTAIVAREWSSDYVWAAHANAAVKAGVAKGVIDAIAEGRPPQGMTDDEAICYDFTTELMRNKTVSDATYGRALKRFGEKGVDDMIGVAGYYVLISMQLNVAQTPPPTGAPPLPRLPK